MRTNTTQRGQIVALLAGCLLAGAATGEARAATVQDGKPPHLAPWPRDTADGAGPKPVAPPAAILELVGEYGPQVDRIYLYERGGRLWLRTGRSTRCMLTKNSHDEAELIGVGACAMQTVVILRNAGGRVAGISWMGKTYAYQQVGPTAGEAQLKVTPLDSVPKLLARAVTLAPPAESGWFRASALVEVAKLTPTIRLDVRYATTNNFLGSVFYSQARAFLQRPAAEALARAQRALQPLGYGLLIHDGYRPWYVTRVFWDATPDSLKWLVANPASGSRHNRGAAVDLTLYELKTGRVVEMPSTYDESTPRAYAFYPGGTELQRWHRGLLRRTMEAEGFSVNPEEWWHFDYKDWRTYRIGNVRFEDIK